MLADNVLRQVYRKVKNRFHSEAATGGVVHVYGIALQQGVIPRFTARGCRRVEFHILRYGAAAEWKYMSYGIGLLQDENPYFYGMGLLQGIYPDVLHRMGLQQGGNPYFMVWGCCSRMEIYVSWYSTAAGWISLFLCYGVAAE